MNYRKKTLQDWNNLTEEQQIEVIMHIGTKLNKQEIWYWEGLVYNYRTLQDRIDKAIECIEKSKVKPTSFFEGLRDSLIMPKEEVNILLGILKGSDKE